MSLQRGGDPDGSSYLKLDAVAIAQVNSTRHGSIGPSSVPSEVIIKDPPSPRSSPSSKSYYSNDPDGSVATLNLTNHSTTRKIDDIMEEINEQENDNDEESEKEKTIRKQKIKQKLKRN